MKKILLAVVACFVLSGCATGDGKDHISHHTDHRQDPASEPMVKHEPLKTEQMTEKKCATDCLAHKKLLKMQKTKQSVKKPLKKQNQ